MRAKWQGVVTTSKIYYTEDKKMGLKLVNGQWVNDGMNVPEVSSTDYQNFLKLTPEQQQGFGAAGATFDGTNSLGNYSGLASNMVGQGGTGMWQSIKDSFNPEGASGRSYAGNVMDFAGTAAGIGTGLAGAYYAKKNFDLQKDQQDYLRGREAKSDARIAQFAANAGNGASYKY